MPSSSHPRLAASRLHRPNLLWDRLGVVLSGLCAVHCLAFPVLLILLPWVSWGHALHEAVHPLMALLLVPVTLRATHQHSAGAGLLRLGLGFVWLAVLGHVLLGECVGLVLTLAGSTLLITGHRCNLRGCTVPTEEARPNGPPEAAEAAAPRFGRRVDDLVPTA